MKFEVVVKPDEALPKAVLFVGCRGGTEIGLALRRGLDLVTLHSGALNRATLVLITDGLSDPDPEVRVLARQRGAGGPHVRKTSPR